MSGKLAVGVAIQAGTPKNFQSTHIDYRVHRAVIFAIAWHLVHHTVLIVGSKWEVEVDFPAVVVVVDLLVAVVDLLAVVVKAVLHLGKACVHQGGTWQGCPGLKNTSTRRVLR